MRAMRLSEHRVRAVRGVTAALCFRAGHPIHQVVNRPRIPPVRSDTVARGYAVRVQATAVSLR